MIKKDSIEISVLQKLGRIFEKDLGERLKLIIYMDKDIKYVVVNGVVMRFVDYIEMVSSK